jgi:hypothetical protein
MRLLNWKVAAACIAFTTSFIGAAAAQDADTFSADYPK